MALVALLSNPASTGNRALLPRIRAFCATHQDVFHYELDSAENISDAIGAIARIRPQVLVVNGGDGTVQMVLTELHQGGHFDDAPPPVAVLPNGKTNLIALDLGARGDPMVALARIIELAQGDIAEHVVKRELIALSEGELNNRPVLGMFLGGAGLADTILYCRNTIYPMGLPNGVSHFIAGCAVFASLIFNAHGKNMPPAPSPVRVSLIRDGAEPRRFAFLVVTTLEKMLLNAKLDHHDNMGMKFLAVEQSTRSLVRALWAAVVGKLGQKPLAGVHIEHGDIIRIESDQANVILDGETFCAVKDRPIVLRATAPMPFLRLAA